MTNDPPSAESHDHHPGVPGFRTWRGVYLFVAGCFLAYVTLLAALTFALS